MFEGEHVELLHARTTMQTVLGTGGPGGNGGVGGNALAIANSGVLIVLDDSTVGTLNVTNTDTGAATAAATGGPGGEGGNGGAGVVSDLTPHTAQAVPDSSPVPAEQALPADTGVHSSPPVPAEQALPAYPAVGGQPVSDSGHDGYGEPGQLSGDGCYGQHSFHHGRGWRDWEWHEW